jgi:hypothetical protein
VTGFFPLVEQRVLALDHLECARRFDAAGVCWGPYRTVRRQALAEDPRLSEANPTSPMLEHASGHRYLTPGFPATIEGSPRHAPGRAPRLGEHTDEVLSRCLGLDSGQSATALTYQRLIGLSARAPRQAQRACVTGEFEIAAADLAVLLAHPHRALPVDRAGIASVSSSSSAGGGSRVRMRSPASSRIFFTG